MRSFSWIGAWALIVVAAIIAGYVTGEPFSGVVPILIVALVAWATQRGAESLRRSGSRRNDVVLRRVERLLDDPVRLAGLDTSGLSSVSGRIDGREADFLFWLHRENPPELPGWQWPLWASERPDDDQEPAFGLRVTCQSPIAFDVKKWGVLPGPPFQTVKLAPSLTGDEPVNFTTKTMDAMLFWREREDGRRLAQKLIVESRVWQITVTASAITVWWPAESAWKWRELAATLPGAVEALAKLAGTLDGQASRPTSSARRRSCGRCNTDVARYQPFCTNCGAPWWEEKRVRPLADRR